MPLWCQLTDGDGIPVIIQVNVIIWPAITDTWFKCGDKMDGGTKK